MLANSLTKSARWAERSWKRPRRLARLTRGVFGICRGMWAWLLVPLAAATRHPGCSFTRASVDRGPCNWCSRCPPRRNIRSLCRPHRDRQPGCVPSRMVELGPGPAVHAVRCPRRHHDCPMLRPWPYSEVDRTSAGWPIASASTGTQPSAKPGTGGFVSTRQRIRDRGNFILLWRHHSEPSWQSGVQSHLRPHLPLSDCRLSPAPRRRGESSH